MGAAEGHDRAIALQRGWRPLRWGMRGRRRTAGRLKLHPPREEVRILHQDPRHRHPLRQKPYPHQVTPPASPSRKEHASKLLFCHSLTTSVCGDLVVISSIILKPSNFSGFITGPSSLSQQGHHQE
ncbi:uncharacterized protein LOC116526648 isoform X2 [Sapajus apella]|uniref:Uncharacterized protein LOC116526648 isoform X2 n=1 Tax=Sapajus apella TaxID=9515 RepID=A0A6J3F0B7_SAPAP|nr:uncharacterized protein LOC116526648 isoform X2 [Sapajus apella]